MIDLNSTTERIPIPCGCGCGLPAAYVIIRLGRLAIEITSRHRGEHHTTVLTIGDVKSMLYAVSVAVE